MNEKKTTEVEGTERVDSRPTGETLPPQCPVVPVDQAVLAAAREDVEQSAKVLSKAAKAASLAAWQLQFAAGEGAPEFEDGLLLDRVAMRKRYTAQHANENEIRRDLCIYLLGRCTPVEDVGRLLRMNYRTVIALAELNAHAVTVEREDYANWLEHNAKKAIVHAVAKLPEANSLQAGTLAGILQDKARDVRANIPQGGEEMPVVELEDPALKSAREFLKLKSAKAVEQKGTEGNRCCENGCFGQEHDCRKSPGENLTAENAENTKP